MLVELYGENFGCFQNEFRLSMIASNKIDPRSNRGIIEVPIQGKKKPLRLLRSVAIYGPNASGKSTLLQAAKTLHHLISADFFLRSYSLIPTYEPFAFGDSKSKPVCLGITAVIKDKIYKYEIKFTASQFVYEQLIQLKPNQTEIILFNRQNQTVTGEWTTNKQFNLILKDFRPNALILNLVDRFAPEVTKQLVVRLRNLLRTGSPSGPTNRWWPDSPMSAIAKRVHNSPSFKNWLLQHLKAADIGITEVAAQSIRLLRHPDPIHKTELAEMSKAEVIYRLALEHRGPNNESVSLPYSRESEGTRRFILLAPRIYNLIRSKISSATFVDEIDESLHPLLLQDLLRHVNCALPKISGQLIFTTHDTSLLDDRAQNAILRRDQIYLTEKDSQGRASLYSVADFKERQVHNIGQRYLQGRYGAIPALGSFGE